MKNKGFTMVELLGTIVILGILMMIGIIAYSRYKDKAVNDAYNTLVSSASSAAEEYFMDFPTETTVSLEELLETGYIDNIHDPKSKETNCTGEVSIIESSNTNATEIDTNAYKITISCSDYNYSKYYSNNKDESYQYNNDGEITTNGVNEFYNM